jgi:hypothetical protein
VTYVTICQLDVSALVGTSDAANVAHPTQALRHLANDDQGLQRDLRLNGT